MTDRPILFSAPMVRALLAGRKTQTRRLAKFVSLKPDGLHLIRNAHGGVLNADDDCVRAMAADYAPIAAGDRLWVREAWNSNGLNWGRSAGAMSKALGRVHYAATDTGDWKPYWGRWKSSIHMPRWASRLTLTVTDARVQRLQDISEEDARAEGSQEPSLAPIIGACWSERDAYAKLWEHINGAGSWAANPWVVAYTFTAEQQNIDQHARAA